MTDGLPEQYGLDPVPLDEPTQEPETARPMEDAVAFLRDLEAETHTATKTSTLKDYSRVEYTRHEYHRDVTPEEADHLFETVWEEDLIIYPSLDFPETGNPGVGGRAYSVVEADRAAPGIEPAVEPVIRFKTRQLPDAYSDADVREMVDRERNHELLSVYDLPELDPDETYPSLVDWT